MRTFEHWTICFKGGGSCALNLANSRGYSIKEVIAVAEKVCGRTVPLETVGRRPGDPPILIGDAGRLAQSLAGDPFIPIWRHRLDMRGTG